MSSPCDVMLTLVSLALSACVATAAECDRMIVSNPNGPKNGTFTSPSILRTNSNHVQCLYTFIGEPNERVKVAFTTFSLKGTTPESDRCRYEYIDIYAELDKPETDLIATSHGGRYCGHVPPRTRVSLHRTLVLGYYSNSDTIIGKFEGTYEFIDASVYVFGTTVPPPVCGLIIHGSHKREGELLSPTYPGTYPKNMVCFYKFSGSPGQRVRLEFLDFDLFAGGAHCPYDYVRFYDGPTKEDSVIRTYCGVQRNLVIFSSKENLYVEFRTGKTDLENRGFKAKWSFSEKFVKLDFIQDKYAYHIKGTECDQRITSRGETNGTIYSPNFPYPYLTNIKCRYFIDGLKDQQHLEKVLLNFTIFQITSHGLNCTNGLLSAHSDVKDEEEDLGEPDKLLCGSTIPPEIVSKGPRLVLLFNSGEVPAQGFKANYQFVKDFGIPGNPHIDGSCHFIYERSTDIHEGVFNSPRHPSNYPMNLTCLYLIKGYANEQVLLYFDLFTISGYVDKVATYGDMCKEDYVEVYNVFHPDSRQAEKLVGRYCGKSTPGPIKSEIGASILKIIFHSDGIYKDNKPSVTAGFRARYLFIPATKHIDVCGQNSSLLENGVISSVNFPDKYLKDQHCEWFIHVQRYQRILIQFVAFEIEGKPADRGCSTAVIRIYPNLKKPPIEWCGSMKMDMIDEVQQFVSDENIMRISFITNDKAQGAQGFEISWTAISKDDAECSTGFKCNNNSFCIAKTLKCNKLPNCGFADNSDEEKCISSTGINVTLIVGLTAGTGFLCIIVTVIVCHRKCKRRREKDQREANKSRVRESTVHYRPTTLEV